MPLPDPLRQDQRDEIDGRCRNQRTLGPRRGGIPVLERMLRRFRAPAQLAHRRLLVQWQSRRLRVDPDARTVVARPARTGPPSAAPRHRAGTWVVVDGKLR
jgi:hypothetical protein